MRTNGLIFILALIAQSGAVSLFAQQNGVYPASLETEIRGINQTLENPQTNDTGRYDALVRLARIQILSGDIEAAAVTWEQAAYAVAGKRDDAALLENAACLMAMGEWDKADANVRIVLLTARDDRKSYIKAKYLSAQIEAFRSGSNVVLDSYLDDTDFAQEKAAIYYILWKTSGLDEYKNRLLIEYPESPETKSLLVESGVVTGVSIFPGAMWLLSGQSFPVSAAKAIQAPAGKLETASLPALQTGLFTTRNNALAQQSRLATCGFEASVSLRQAGGAEYWIVSVPSGSDLNSTVLKLKEAGFEALPVF
ncbi:MAG: hypothetical protein LBG74_04000 [Spirochaetaceae bacterium]|jgi:hypothetical protein|nr:hypothetical protein [Spirochaetaceae bacterium]